MFNELYSTHFRRPLLPRLATVVIFALAVGASACGGEDSQGKGVAEDERVEVGALSAKVLSSRYLDRKDKEDAAYLAGQPPAGRNLAWFGVFLEMQNEGEKTQRVPTVAIVDSTGRIYSAFPTDSDQALRFGETLKPNERLPNPETGIQQGPDRGALVIFRLGKAAIKNRPLILHIESFYRKEADVRLDF